MPHRAQASRLRAPTTESALQALTQVLGCERAREVFDQAATQQRVSADDLLTREVESLLQIASWLALSEGIVSVLGLALRIRCETYLSLRDEELP